ncbi:MAG: hypothetical protein HGA45_23285, partial [Chloroflexales bacterium]|nr:hypothetical protein [Chloroflexales bacterium]
MPRVSVFIIRTALLQLALGATLGGLLLIEKGLRLAPWLWTLRPGHIQMMLIGWTLQLACGVAVWILPRLDAAGRRGSLGLVWLYYGALNGGVALAALHQPLTALRGAKALGWMLPLAGLLYVVAVVAAVGHLWQRVLPFRTPPRPTGAWGWSA